MRASEVSSSKIFLYKFYSIFFLLLSLVAALVILTKYGVSRSFMGNSLDMVALSISLLIAFQGFILFSQYRKLVRLSFVINKTVGSSSVNDLDSREKDKSQELNQTQIETLQLELNEAASSGDVSRCKDLLQQGSNPHLATDNVSPRDYALGRGHKNVLALFDAI